MNFMINRLDFWQSHGQVVPSTTVDWMGDHWSPSVLVSYLQGLFNLDAEEDRTVYNVSFQTMWLMKLLDSTVQKWAKSTVLFWFTVGLILNLACPYRWNRFTIWKCPFPEIEVYWTQRWINKSNYFNNLIWYLNYMFEDNNNIYKITHIYF